MSLLTENIIPGNHGKIFGTDASSDAEIERIKSKILKIDGVEKVSIIEGVYPKELIVYTSKLLSIVSIQEAVKKSGFHAIPRGLFEL